MLTRNFRPSCLNANLFLTPKLNSNNPGIEDVYINDNDKKDKILIQNKILEEPKLKYYSNKRKKVQEINREYYLKNKEKWQKMNREYYLKNKEQLQKSAREYNLNNKEKRNEYLRDYCLKNKGERKEYHRIYYSKNKRIRLEYNREYRVKNSEKLLEKYIIKKRMKNGKFIFRKTLFWSDQKSVRKFLDSAAKLLYISSPSDWYRISKSQIIKVGGAALLRRFRTLGNSLCFAYPEQPWDLSNFLLKRKKSNQRWLLVQLKLLLPNVTIVEDYNHPSLLWDSDKPAQIDVYVPSIKLGLEYQGEQHYKELQAFGPGNSLNAIVNRDKEKKEMCLSNGIILVSIPYWWDGTKDSLSSTLNLYFPNLFHKTASLPIAAIKCGTKMTDL